MSAVVTRYRASASTAAVSAAQAKFLALLPRLLARARTVFRAEPAWRREELVAEMLAHCWAALVRLLERGREASVYPTPLANFAIHRVRCGRSLGRGQKLRDVSSVQAQHAQGFCVERLDRREPDGWQQILVEDHRAGPAEIAASRLDFAAWLRALSPWQRRVANLLATGETTCGAARLLCISPARISQMRRELRDSWRAFVGESIRN